ncbi:ATP-binding protein [Paenibacillus sp. LHD-117]|uniref:sensor histidine kinase n=1 Tax=Paenibacillus sp. LHD-117 TaxID=3071412 RepID=UPI0027E01CA6|nr:ATP-binding protein [Paenibacillus sp. LHD-117]MDQ6418557.1 ATP-binding protein [Paenibacillus sp. LHD-117]
MKDNIAARLVWRSLLNLIASSVLALVCLSLLFAVAFFMTNNFPSLYFIRSVGGAFLNNTGTVGMVFLWGVLFLGWYLLLQWVMFTSIGKVNDAIGRIADGQLDLNYQIPVRSGVIGILAGNVNRLSNRLQQALDEERRAEQTKNELITNVSHDLRTPLTSVVGYLGLIDQDGYRDEVELRQYVSIAYEKSQRLHDLINDLFEYTRMRHDTIALRLAPINLVEMLGQLLVQYHMPLQEAGMESGLASAETTVMIQADAAKLVRVFENLISNAMLYGKEGKRVDIAIHSRERDVVAEVVNYGEPIPAVDLPYLFDRFYRVDKSRTQWSGGSGLGLAISKSIIEKHGGTIDVVSNAEYTAFRVTLPKL